MTVLIFRRLVIIVTSLSPFKQHKSIYFCNFRTTKIILTSNPAAPLADLIKTFEFLRKKKKN